MLLVTHGTEHRCSMNSINSQLNLKCFQLLNHCVLYLSKSQSAILKLDHRKEMDQILNLPSVRTPTETGSLFFPQDQHNHLRGTYINIIQTAAA